MPPIRARCWRWPAMFSAMRRKAWWLTIPAVKLGFSENLSPEAQRGFAEAVKKIQELCR